MHNRLRLMMGATALLYFGPLLAGLGGFGWRTVPVFAAVFLLWSVVMRPAVWPRRRDEWSRPERLVAVLSQAAVLILLVVVCYGIGRGLGGVFGALPPFPIVVPVAVSLLSIPLGRALFDPDKAEAMDRFLDTALADITAASAGLPPDRSDARALTARLLAPLQALPDTTTDDEIARHLSAIAAHAAPADIAHVLLSAAEQGSASRTGLRALVLHATDPQYSDQLGGSETPARTFHLIAHDPDLTRLFARRSADQLRDDPAVWWDSVNPENLRSVAAGAAPDLAAALSDLAALTETLTPPDSVVDRHHVGS